MKATRYGLRLLTGLLFLGAAVGQAAPATAGDPGTARTLFDLTNQDRTSNGLGAVGYNGNLSSIATSAQASGCGNPHGRSQDMIDRNYFAHQIPPCGSYVWQVFNLGPFTAAGENIGWNNYPPGDSVNQINTAFMNSPEHRANILGNFNQMGTGAWLASGPWSGAGGPYNGVIMYTEIFINASGGGGGAPPPPPPPPPPPSRPPPPRPVVNNGGGTPPPVVPVPTDQPTAPPDTPAPSPSPSIPSCPVPTDIGEADRTSPAPTLASDGGPAPCPNPNLTAVAPSAGPASGTTGSIDAGSAVLSVAASDGIVVGDIVTVPGAGEGGSDLTAQVVTVNAKAITLGRAAVTAVKNVTVGVSPAAEVQGADREATHRGILETVVDQVLRLFLNV